MSERRNETASGRLYLEGAIVGFIIGAALVFSVLALGGWLA